MRDLVLLFVTKYSFLPAARSMSSVSGTPGMTESPFQMTPSQSKMKALVLARRGATSEGARRGTLAVDQGGRFKRLLISAS